MVYFCYAKSLDLGDADELVRCSEEAAEFVTIKSYRELQQEIEDLLQDLREYAECQPPI